MPESWPPSKIGDLADWRGGLTPSMANPAFWSGGDIPWISSKEVVGGVLKDTERKVTRQAVDETSLRLTPAGSVAVVVRSGILLHTFPVALVPFETTVNQDIKIGTPRQGVLAEYLAYCVDAHGQRILERCRKTGTTVQSVDVPGFLAFEVPLPPLEVQRRIVDLIGALDAQAEALDLEDWHLDRFLTSLREAMVAGVSWGPVRAMVAPNGVQIGPFGAQLHAHDYTDEGVPVVMPQDIIDGEIKTAKIKRVPEAMAASLARHRLLPGDLVLPRQGDLTKRALVGTEQRGWLCGTGSIRIRLSDPSLAPALLEGLSTRRTDEWLITNAVGTTMLNLNTEIVSKLPAPVFSPDDKDFAEACVSARQALRANRAESNSLHALRSKVLSALLSSEVEIPESYDALLEAV